MLDKIRVVAYLDVAISVADIALKEYDELSYVDSLRVTASERASEKKIRKIKELLLKVYSDLHVQIEKDSKA